EAIVLEVRFGVTVVDPAGVIGDPPRVVRQGREAHTMVWGTGRTPSGFGIVTKEVWAGAPDPRDASQFLMRAEVGGVPLTVVGRLADDDTVSFSVREGAPAGTR
ncbi:MAG: hypothetical protein ACAI43_07320, partial [Phycisphaerae bacterium]